MSTLYRSLYLLVTIIQCLYNVNPLNSNDNDKDNESLYKSVCIADKNDIISGYYKRIMYDPRINNVENPDTPQPLLTCKNHSIWISSTNVIYYKEFTEQLSYNDASNHNPIEGFGVFECGSNKSYITAMKSQSNDYPDSMNNFCIDPGSIYPDSYPGCTCNAKPIAYCLPFNGNCPQFQATMNSMYTDNELNYNLKHFYECNCWYKPNIEGDNNNDQEMFIDIDFDINECKKEEQIKRISEKEKEEQLLRYRSDQKQARDHQIEEREEKEEEHEHEIEIEKNREFSILWASLASIIGFIMLIIIGIYSCRKNYHKKMYLTSRKYLRNKHYGQVENRNLMDNDYSDTDTDDSDASSSYTDSTGSYTETTTNVETEIDTAFSESLPTDQLMNTSSV